MKLFSWFSKKERLSPEEELRKIDRRLNYGYNISPKERRELEDRKVMLKAASNK